MSASPPGRRSARSLVKAGVLVAALLAAAPGAYAGAIPFDTFLQFSFGAAGTAAAGCDPADPAGSFCSASSGTPTQFLDAPAWTFDAPAGGATLTVVDAFTSRDRFEIFDFGVSLGLTSALAFREPVDCGDDPLDCLASPFMDSAVFVLGAGAHSLTLIATESPSGGGSAYLNVTAAVVPEPASLALVFGGLAAAFGSRRFSAKGST